MGTKKEKQKKKKYEARRIKTGLVIFLSIAFGGFSWFKFSPEITLFNTGADVASSQSPVLTQAPAITVSPSFNLEAPPLQKQVLGVEDIALRPFNIKDWNLEKGLVLSEDGSICSRGRSDRPILVASYISGLSVDEIVVINLSVREYGKVKTGEQHPKAILIYDDSRIFFPSVDIERVNFYDKNKPEQQEPNNKLLEPVDVTRPMRLVFEPSRLIANKLAYRYSFKYRSTDPEIPEEVTSLGSFESYQDGDNDGFPRKFSFGLYVGTCVKISSFDTSSLNEQILSGNYFK